MNELIEFIRRHAVTEPEATEVLIEEHLKKNPDNIELWIRLAILELSPPLADYYKSIDCLKRVLEYENDNFYAIVLLAYVNDSRLGGVQEELYNKLCMCRTTDNEEKSIVEMAKSWYYRHNDMGMYEKQLVSSISLCGSHVWNRVELGQLNIRNGMYEEGTNYIKSALKNVKLVYSTNEVTSYDLTDFREFFNEHLKGTHLTQENFNFIKGLLE